VNTPADILHHPQLVARNYWYEMTWDNIIKVKYPSRFCLPSYSPCRQWRPAPCLGQHNAEVYEELLGFKAEEISRLREAGVI